MGIVWVAVVEDHGDICQSNDLGQKRMDLLIVLTDTGRGHVVASVGTALADGQMNRSFSSLLQAWFRLTR